MKRIITLCSALFVLLSLSSCKEEWLKPKPLSFFAPENVYVDKAGFESLLITMRKDLKSENTGPINFLINEFAASDLAVASVQLDFYKLTPNTDRYYKYLAMFTSAYASIKNANVLISRIDDITWSNPEERNAILSEALWHRAYWYYRLVNSYGDVPFISQELTGAKLDFATHSRWAILKKIQTDLEFAVQNLPVKASPGVISKGAGDHLLAKVYLANLEFDKAIEASSRVINGPYALMKSRFGVSAGDAKRDLMWDLHRPKNFNLATNTETILAIVDRFEAPPGARSQGLYTMRHYNCAWWNTIVRDSQGKAGMVASGPMYDSLGRGNGNVRLDAFYQYSLWNYKNTNWRNTPDLRRSNNNWVDLHEIKYNNPASVDYGKPINVSYLAAPADTFYAFYAMPHYIVYVPQDDALAIPMGGNGRLHFRRTRPGTVCRRTPALRTRAGVVHPGETKQVGVLTGQFQSEKLLLRPRPEAQQLLRPEGPVHRQHGRHRALPRVVAHSVERHHRQHAGDHQPEQGLRRSRAERSSAGNHRIITGKSNPTPV